MRSFNHDPMLCGTNDLQELSKTHNIVSRSKTELWHRILIHYLPLYFPEAEKFHHSSRSDWFFAFLERYPSPHFISAMSQEAIIADAWLVVGRKVSKKNVYCQIFTRQPRHPWDCQSNENPTPQICSNWSFDRDAI